MIKFDKKKILLFLLCFFLVFFIYYLTLSENMSYDSDFLYIPLEVEGRTVGRSPAIAHILWIPVCKLVYKTALFMGYTGGAIKPIEILSAFLSGIGSAVFLILIYELTNSLLLSICLSALLSFSYVWWLVSVLTKLYSGGFLFNILTFYLYTRKDFKFKSVIIGATSSLAVLFHITNIGLLISSILYFLLGTEKLKEKILRAVSFLLTFGLIVFISYYIVQILYPYYRLSTSYVISWLDYFKFQSVIFLGRTLERIAIEPQTLAVMVYLCLFFYLFIATFKNIIRNRLFYLSLAFGSILVAVIKILGPINANFVSVLIPFNIIFALMLKGYKQFFKFKKTAIGIILVVFAVFTFANNFIVVYSSKEIKADYLYKLVIERTNNIISSSDIIFANSMIPPYLRYYTECKVLSLNESYNDNDNYSGLTREIDSYLNQKERVKIFLDKSINFDNLLKRLSNDYDLKLLYKPADNEAWMAKIELYEIEKKSKEAK